MEEHVFIEQEVLRIRKRRRGSSILRSRALDREFRSSAARTRADDRISALVAKTLLIEEIHRAQRVNDTFAQICIRAWEQFSPALAENLKDSGTREILGALHAVSISRGHTLCAAWLRHSLGGDANGASKPANDGAGRVGANIGSSVPRNLLMSGEIYPAWREVSMTESDPSNDDLSLLAYSLLLDSTSLAAAARAAARKRDRTATDISSVEIAILVLIARGEESLSSEPIFGRFFKPPFSTRRRLLNIVRASQSMDLRASLDFLVTAEELVYPEERTLALAVLARSQRQSRKAKLANHSEELYREIFRAFDNEDDDAWNLLKNTRNKSPDLQAGQDRMAMVTTPKSRFKKGVSLSWRVANILGPRDMSRLLIGRLPLASISDVTLAEISKEVTSHCSKLKGPLMKVGQTASYFCAGLPDIVSTSLGNLQSNAEPVAWNFIEGTLVRRLGNDWPRWFLEIGTTPIAVGSIAQIHAAKLHTGEDVVLKVRLPEIRKIVLSDLTLLRGLSHLITLLTPKRGGHAIQIKPFLDELERQMLAECDFNLEAASMERARLRFCGDTSIHIPKVYSAFTSEELLVLEKVDGLSLEEAISSRDQRKMDLWGESLVRFVVSSCRDADFNSDPHPGNFIFSDNGIYCLDFGSTIQWDAEAKRTWNMLIQACTQKSFDIYRSAFRISESDQDPAYFEQYKEIVRSGAGSWTHPAHQALSEDVIRMQMLALSETILQNEKARRVVFPPAFLFGMRVYFGHLSVVARLGARANWNDVAATIMSARQ